MEKSAITSTFQERRKKTRDFNFQVDYVDFGTRFFQQNNTKLQHNLHIVARHFEVLIDTSNYIVNAKSMHLFERLKNLTFLLIVFYWKFDTLLDVQHKNTTNHNKVKEKKRKRNNKIKLNGKRGVSFGL